MDESAFSTKPVIQSMLDTDYYTFTMQQAILHLFPNVEVEYKLIVRADESLAHLIPEVRQQLELMSELQMREDELRFLFDKKRREYLTPDYERFLSLFRMNLRYANVCEEDGQLAIRVRGPILHCINFEQPLLAMISELRNREKYPHVLLSDIRNRLYEKFEWLEKNASKDELALFRVSDFGTRRRLSALAHREVVNIMRHDFPGVFVGTSNAKLAYDFNLPLIGTMAHQWLMLHQQVTRLKDSQKLALENWVKEYRGRLGVALTDCISTDVFYQDFDLYFSKLYDGVRQDSGCPFTWTDKSLAHYLRMGIDPLSKELTYSDGLDFPKALEILRYVRGKAKFGFGMGTSLACDAEGVQPLSIVMKLVSVEDQPVVKFTDDPTKIVCEDPSFQQYAANTFGLDNLAGTPQAPAAG